MRIYMPALSRVRLAVWLSQRQCIPGIDPKRWKRLLKAQEDVLYPAELMLLSISFPQDEFQIEGEVQYEQTR
jgi:hypothetical protein